jgi:hypothetical protein
MSSEATKETTMSYAGYSPAEARKIARAIDARADRELHEQYLDYAAEARACGYEVESFAEWNGDEDPKAKAHERLAMIDADDIDLY